MYKRPNNIKNDFKELELVHLATAACIRYTQIKKYNIRLHAHPSIINLSHQRFSRRLTVKRESSYEDFSGNYMTCIFFCI